MALFGIVGITAISCYRPSDTYEVSLYGEGTELDEILPEPTPRGGQFEYARFRLYGSNLGHGLTGLYGDSPLADGTSLTVGYGYMGYPADAGFDRNSTFVSPGPPVTANEDACMTRLKVSGYLGISEYVDGGDHALLKGEGGQVVLERDPSTHHRPAGESWFAGYGGTLLAAVQDHPYLPDRWQSDATWTLSLPGTLVPPESTMGSVPYPTSADVLFPPDIADLAVAGAPIRAQSAYDTAGHPGPWEQEVELTWTPSEAGTPLTVTVRYLGLGDEGTCELSADCGWGLSCLDGTCQVDGGSGLYPVGEVVCTVADDGSFALTPDMVASAQHSIDPGDVQGVVLGVARLSEGELPLPDVLTYNGLRVEVGAARTRLVDVIYTRLEAP